MLGLVLVVALLPLCFAQSFSGTWTDVDFGRSLYVCISGENFYGFYSEVGILRGTVSDKTFTGYWYEGGGRYDNGTLTYGPAVLTLNSKGNAFTGYYSFEGSSTKAAWNAKRISTDAPTFQQCWWSNSSRTDTSLSGVWATTTQTLSLCDTEEDTFYATRSSTTNGPTFATGLIEDDIYRGNYFNFNLNGAILIASYGNDQIGVNTWAYAPLLVNPVNLTSVGHSYTQYSPVEGETGDCLSYWSN